MFCLAGKSYLSTIQSFGFVQFSISFFSISAAEFSYVEHSCPLQPTDDLLYIHLFIQPVSY